MKEKCNIKLQSCTEVIQIILIQGRNQANQCYQPESLCLEKTAEHKAPTRQKLVFVLAFFLLL